MEQLAHGGAGLALGDGLTPVRGVVADILEISGFVEHGVAHGGAKARLVQEGAQGVLVWELEARVVFVEPGHGDLDRAANVDGAGTRVGEGEGFGALGGLVHGGPFGLQESELRHGGYSSPRNARCWREVKRASEISQARCIFSFRVLICCMYNANFFLASTGGRGMGSARRIARLMFF